MRRGTSSAAGRTGALSSSDSILMIQQKLLNLIDTMSGVLERDTKRIRILEQEIQRLKARLGETGSNIIQPPTYTAPHYNPPSYSSQSYFPSPPDAARNTSPHGVAYGGNVTTDPTGVSVRELSDNEKAALLPPPPKEYTDALMQFNARKYKEAFRRFDQLEQNDPSSAYTPNYVYWRGESLFALARFAEAAIDFKAVADHYPNSLKGDDAQLKYAESLDRLGARDQALLEYQRLIQRYPLSEYRSRAESKMRSLQ